MSDQTIQGIVKGLKDWDAGNALLVTQNGDGEAIQVVFVAIEDCPEIAEILRHWTDCADHELPFKWPGETAGGET